MPLLLGTSCLSVGGPSSCCCCCCSPLACTAAMRLLCGPRGKGRALAALKGCCTLASSCCAWQLAHTRGCTTAQVPAQTAARHVTACRYCGTSVAPAMLHVAPGCTRIRAPTSPSTARAQQQRASQLHCCDVAGTSPVLNCANERWGTLRVWEVTTNLCNRLADFWLHKLFQRIATCMLVKQSKILHKRRPTT